MSKSYIDGNLLKAWYTWLKDEDEGCCHKVITKINKYEICIVVGWGKNYNDKWSIHWKIGQQPFNNGMQCDFDIDFEMPCYSNGEVIDTRNEIGETSENFDWDKFAKTINETANYVIEEQLCKIDI